MTGSFGVGTTLAFGVDGLAIAGSGSFPGVVVLWAGLASLGLFGLATDREPVDSLAELIARVERLADGEEVSFPTDRDDDLGRLAAALEDLAGQVREERNSELERYRQYTNDVLDAIDDLFYVLDEEGTLLRWNRALPEVTGYSPAEIEGMHALEFFPEDERERIADRLAEVFRSGEARVETELLTTDGRTPYEFVATRLPDPDGNTVLAGIGRDISRRKERERTLRERERELSTLMDNVPGMVYRARNEQDWPFEFVSEGAREVTGYAPETLESGDVNWGREIIDDNEALWEAVQAALDRRESYEVTYRITDADGERRWLWEQGRGVFDEDGTLDAIEGVILDITEQRRREQELERTKNFLEQTQRIASVGGWELDLREGPPFEGAFTDELYRIHGLPVGADVNMERGLEFYHPDHRDQVREAVERAIEAGERYELEAILVTAEDEERWVRTTGVPIFEDGELVTLRGALQDITDQKEYELALEALQETTRGLLGTETQREVADLVVDRGAGFLSEPCLAVYLLEEETNQLEPARLSDAFVDLCGEPEPVSIDRDDSVLWDAFVSGERTLVDAEAAEESSVLGSSVECGLIHPLDDDGVFVAATPESAFDDRTLHLIETLVATTEAALDRLESETLLREREAELADRNRRLRRQVQITDIIRSIHTSLIGAESRADIERTVCERLVEAEHIRFAWIGSLEATGDGVAVRAWEGTGQDYLDELSFDGDSSEPSAVTARTGESAVLGNVLEGLGSADWHQQALLRDFHSIVSVPLVFDEFSAGVLTVYADEPDAFSDLERTVFTELGESIANAIIAVNTREALHAETLVELTLRLAGDALFTRVARDANCQVRYEGFAANDGEESRLFFTTTGAAGETVLSVLEDLVSVTDARLVSTSDDQHRFEVTVAEETLPARLARHGGQLRSAHVDGQLELVVDVPPTTDVREFLDMLDEEYDAVELLGRRDVERSIQTRLEFLEYVLDELTDRQLEVLRTAYYAGFFEWPRASTGEDIAEMLGVTQPTVNRHLRLGQQRLLEALFEQTVVERE